MKDLGWNITYPSASTTVVGSIASDAETEGPATYGVSHVVAVTTKTDVRIEPAVSFSIDSKDGSLSKEFVGVGINVTNMSKNSGSDDISASGTADLTFNGKQYSASLGEPEGPTVKETETSVTTGNITIPASEVSKGATFPSISVKGNWWNIRDDRTATPVVVHGIIPYPLSYENKFSQYTPPKQQ